MDSSTFVLLSDLKVLLTFALRSDMMDSWKILEVKKLLLHWKQRGFLIVLGWKEAVTILHCVAVYLLVVLDWKEAVPLLPCIVVYFAGFLAFHGGEVNSSSDKSSPSLLKFEGCTRQYLTPILHCGFHFSASPW